MCDGEGCGRCDDGRVSVMEALALREAMYRPSPGQKGPKPVVMLPETGDIHKWQLARHLATAIGFGEKSGQNRVSTAARTRNRLRGHRIERKRITADERAEFGTTRADFVFRAEPEKASQNSQPAATDPDVNVGMAAQVGPLGEVCDWNKAEEQQTPAEQVFVEPKPDELLVTALWDIATLTQGPAQGIAIATLRKHYEASK